MTEQEQIAAKLAEAGYCRRLRVRMLPGDCYTIRNRPGFDRPPQCGTCPGLDMSKNFNDRRDFPVEKRKTYSLSELAELAGVSYSIASSARRDFRRRGKTSQGAETLKLVRCMKNPCILFDDIVLDEKKKKTAPTALSLPKKEKPAVPDVEPCVEIEQGDPEPVADLAPVVEAAPELDEEEVPDAPCWTPLSPISLLPGHAAPADGAKTEKILSLSPQEDAAIKRLFAPGWEAQDPTHTPKVLEQAICANCQTGPSGPAGQSNGNVGARFYAEKAKLAKLERELKELELEKKFKEAEARQLGRSHNPALNAASFEDLIGELKRRMPQVEVVLR